LSPSCAGGKASAPNPKRLRSRGGGFPGCHLAVFVAALALAAMAPAAALAFETHLYTGSSFGPDGTAASRFIQPGALASDAAGNVYGAEIAGKRIEKFSAAGAPLDFSSTPGSNAIAGISFRGGARESQIAVSSASGAIFATSDNSVLAFSSTGQPFEFTA